MTFDVMTSFSVWTPASTLGLTQTSNNPKLDFGDSGFAVDQPSLHFGTITSPGVTFSASVKAPSFVDGTIFLVQLVSDYIHVKTPTKSYISHTSGFVLDDGGGNVDYGGHSVTVSKGGFDVLTNDLGHPVTDSPSVSPLDVDPMANYVGRIFSSKDYLMWQPGGGDSVPVALKEISWFFVGGVHFNNSNPALHDAVEQFPWRASVSVPATELPEWSDYDTDPIFNFKQQ